MGGHSVRLDRCLRIVELEFEVMDVEVKKDSAKVLVGLPRRGDLESSLLSVYKKLTASGCYPSTWRGSDGLAIYMHVRSSGRGLLTALALAAATIVTVYMSGLALSLGEGLSWSPLAYMIGLLAPLLIHEMGHWITMMVYRVPRSLPYFIPAPPIQLGFLGTFGAVVNLRWLPPNPDSLALMAVMGPLAGFLAALPLTVVGLMDSLVLEPGEAVGAAALPVVPLIMVILARLLGLPEDSVIVLSPLAFAGYIVFLITFLNLLPIGSLDGGHIVRSVAGERGHAAVSLSVVAVAVGLTAVYPALAIFAFIALAIYMLMGGRHPGSAMIDGNPGIFSALSVAIYSILLGLTAPIPI